MTFLRADILILGSGFGGSLLALILARAGKSVVMVDRARHPRFAIGESSTPLADRTLAQMADRYGLPELRPLCHWGSWKRECSQLLCGRKRGFTYFDLTGRNDLITDTFDSQRLLVAASVDNEHSDTHWLRSDVDQFFFQLAQASGVTAFQQCRYSLNQQQNQWTLHGDAEESATAAPSLRRRESDSSSQPVSIHAPFLIDATGSNNGVLKFLKVPDLTHQLKTNSRSIFAHFASVTTCERLLLEQSIDVEPFPYDCDDAAVHQVLPDGWMWQLRYDDDSLSAGFMIDERPGVPRADRTFATSADEWDWRIERTPFLLRQFGNAKVIRPDSGLQSTRRIQRLAGQGAGHHWAAITNTVGFIDPLHSTGIAHTLFSVSRLADILVQTHPGADRDRRLRDYSESLINEIRCIDEIVEGCYEAIPSFRLWCLWGMLYFAAATSMEQQPDSDVGKSSFLRASDSHFRTMLQEGRKRLAIARQASIAERNSAETEFASWLKSAIEPWNHVGLFDDTCNNLYSRTAAPVDAW